MTTSRDQQAFSPNVSPVCTSDLYSVTHEATKGENRQSGGRDVMEGEREKSTAWLGVIVKRAHTGVDAG